MTAGIVGVAALSGAAVVMAYLMLKEEEDFRTKTRGQHVSSRYDICMVVNTFIHVHQGSC